MPSSGPKKSLGKKKKAKGFGDQTRQQSIEVRGLEVLKKILIEVYILRTAKSSGW